MTVGELGERGLIGRLRQRSRSPGPGVLIGPGDDAAVMAWPGGELLLTTDMLIEGVHFRRTTASLREIGSKTLAVNISDVAAMGGEPRFAVVAIALPPGCPLADVDALYAGLEDTAARYGVALVGGDTCESPGRLILNVALVGSLVGPPVRRSGAGPGDAILVTGSLGAAAAGLAALERGPLPLDDALLATVHRAHRLPTPRVREAALIRASGAATAMIDLSDGLATDLGHIATESGVGADVHLALLPIADGTGAVAAALGADACAWAVSGGEDYELLFTAVPDRALPLARHVTAETGTPVTLIGEIRAKGHAVRFLDDAGHDVPVRPGYEHFRA